jgi:hypothetical protein
LVTIVASMESSEVVAQYSPNWNCRVQHGCHLGLSVGRDTRQILTDVNPDQHVGAVT